MRKINKQTILAKTYKEWEESFSTDADHPEYSSSKGRFYHDIVANLVWIQKGLCSYTEYFMEAHQKFAPENWTDNRFASNFKPAGVLDHYDPDLKPKKGWLWSNFFVIDTDINTKIKGRKKPKAILKPDTADFDPAYFLAYNPAQHIFIPNPERTIEEQGNILHDITVLGLNWQPTVERRENYLTDKINDVKYGGATYTSVFASLFQFFTAFELSRHYMEN
jgi:hypothetical protein